MRKKGYLMRDDFNDDSVFLTLQQAYDYFYSAKKAENIREKTLVTYVEHFRFFTNWLEITDYNLKSVIYCKVVRIIGRLFYLYVLFLTILASVILGRYLFPLITEKKVDLVCKK